MRLRRGPEVGRLTGARANFPRSIADAVGRVLEVLGVMVTVYPLEHFDAHAEKPCSRPKADAILHHPGRRGMTQSMRRRWRLKAGQFDGALKGGFHQLNRLALNNIGWNRVRIRLEALSGPHWYSRIQGKGKSWLSGRC